MTKALEIVKIYQFSLPIIRVLVSINNNWTSISINDSNDLFVDNTTTCRKLYAVVFIPVVGWLVVGWLDEWISEILIPHLSKT